MESNHQYNYYTTNIWTFLLILFGFSFATGTGIYLFFINYIMIGTVIFIFGLFCTIYFISKRIKEWKENQIINRMKYPRYAFTILKNEDEKDDDIIKYV